jgi:transposase
MDEKLFKDVETPKTSPKEITGEPRLERADRSQVQLYPCDLEALLPADHPARMVWRFTEGLNLQPFYDAILAREQHPGRPAVDPKIVMALWLYATIEGVGSARELDRLCGQHDAYRWLCGGVSINYHTLSDFRVSNEQVLDRLLTDSIAVLLHRNVVKLATVAQDGMRVRTSAGAGSFRRRQSLTECLKRAKQQVDRTARQAEGEITARQAAAQQRAARERLDRVQQALEELARVEATKARQKRPSDPRASTTDAQARVMKMADGGFRPAYNVQFATDVDSRIIVGVELTNSGSDGGQLIPMLDQIEARTVNEPSSIWPMEDFSPGKRSRRPMPSAWCCMGRFRNPRMHAIRPLPVAAIRRLLKSGACVAPPMRLRHCISCGRRPRNGSTPMLVPIAR